MGFPCALGQFHLCEYSLERRVFGRVGINTELYLAATLVHVADAHFGKVLSVLRTFYAIVIFLAGETVSYRLHLDINGGSGPIEISVVGDYAPQVLKFFVLIFHAAFQPVFAIKVHHDAALVKTVMAFREICLDYKTEVFFLCIHLEHRGIVVQKMVVCMLPQVCAWLRHDLYGVVLDCAVLRLPCPSEVIYIQCHDLLIQF